MPVIIKTKNLKFLEKVGVEFAVIDELKAHGVKLSLGFKDFAIYSSFDKVLSSGTLPISTSDLQEGYGNYNLKADARKIVKDVCSAALYVLKTGATVVLPEPVVTPESPVASVMPDAVKVNPETVLEVPTVGYPAHTVAALSATVVPLCSANEMYQRVRGTSVGSIYVVVALHDELRIAARIHGNQLAIRAEPSSGVFYPPTIDKLKAQGIDHKGHYASGHFECGKVSPGRVLGAVLVGLGIAFETPLPDVSKVAAKSK